MAALAWSPDMSEKQFEGLVVSTARRYGWKRMHVNRSKVRNGDGTYRWVTNTSVPGWPDEFLFHPRGFILVLELKKEDGQLSDDQRTTLQHLQVAADRCAAAGIPRVFRAYCARPSDWPAVERMLAAPMRANPVSVREEGPSEPAQGAPS